MLLPALSRAKMKAQQTQCLNNLKQLTLADFMYLQDAGGKNLPYYPDDPNWYRTLWMGTLITFQAQVDKCRVCPSAQLTNAVNSSGWGTADNAWVWNSTPVLQGSFTFNGWCYSDDHYFTTGDDAGRHFRKEADIQHPSQTPIFAESVWVDMWPRQTDSPASDLYNPFPNGDSSGTIGRCTIGRHGGRGAARAPRSVFPPLWAKLPKEYNIDLALADGRVEKAPLPSLIKYYWNCGYQPP